MRRDAFAWICALALAVLLVVPLGHAADQLTVKGSILAAKETKGKVTAVSIKTDEGEEYRIVNKGKGQELLGLVDKKVELTGTVKEVKGKKRFRVTHYKTVEE